MATYLWDHIHLRSPNPEATALWFEDMLGAEVIRSMQQGQPRIDLKLGGANIFIAPVAPGEGVNAPPVTPYRGAGSFRAVGKGHRRDCEGVEGEGRGIHQGSACAAARHPHLLYSWPAGRVDRAAGARSEVSVSACGLCTFPCLIQSAQLGRSISKRSDVFAYHFAPCMPPIRFILGVFTMPCMASSTNSSATWSLQDAADDDRLVAPERERRVRAAFKCDRT